MRKKVYEIPMLEIISFAAKENLATGGNDNFTSADQFPPFNVDENV